MVLSGFVLTVTATAMTTGVAAAAPVAGSGGAAEQITSTVTVAPTPSATRSAAIAAITAITAITAPGGQPAVAPMPAAHGLIDDAALLPHKPIARPRVRAKAAPSAKVVRKAATRRPATKPATRRPAHRHSTSVAQAVSRIPGYARHRSAKWVVSSKYGNWGVTDWYHNTIYISPRVPSSKLDSVVRHEWAHILTVRAYGGSVDAAIAGTNRAFGGSGLTGAERAADCMARQLGATWTNYTSCGRSSWRSDAAALLRGHRA